jgi:signal transduction histidine kinase
MPSSLSHTEGAAPNARPALLAPWVGWRLRGLVAITLAACLAIFGWMRWLADAPQLPLAFAQAPGGLVLQPDSAVAPPHVSTRTLVALHDAQQQPIALPSSALAPRWTPGDAQRQTVLQFHAALQRAATQGPLSLTWADGSHTSLAPSPRGLVGLGWWPWPLAALALLLVLTGAVLALARPHVSNLLYFFICLCQATGLLFVAAWSAPGLGLPATLVALDMPVRAALDLASVAAALHALLLQPKRPPHARGLAALNGGVIAVCVLGLVSGQLPAAWPVVQALMFAAAVVALWATQMAAREGPQPVVRLVGRLTFSSGVATSLMTLAVLFGTRLGASTRAVELVVLLGSLWLALLLLAPFLLRSRAAMREFAVLAGVSTVAASLDVLFITVFSLSSFTSLTLVVFIALGLYAAARQWLFDRLLASQALTTERIFEQIYRAAREVQAHPERHAQQLAQLLRGLFEPLEVQRYLQPVPHARVAGGGAVLLVPVLEVAAADGSSEQRALLLRHARRGQRIFTREDAQLADRVVEQLRRAVAYDLAVERGRSEERQRIAQDLHDDIGARLLTLMYQAPTPDMEDYVRHTLKDLKTLTRGLAAGEHRLSHALAEWKTDIAQRLGAARVELDWSARYDDDLRLSMVQWSAITRVLRELVSNTLHHGHATAVSVRLELAQQALHLVVADNGRGGDPQSWAPGLGLGGVRKRIKLLGGEVQWRQGEAGAGDSAAPGIVCEVHIAHFAAKAVTPL